MLSYPLDMMMKSIAFALLSILFMVSISAIHFLGDKVFAATDTFTANGQISSLVLGMPPSTHTVNMSSVEKFILSGNWKLVTYKGNIVNFTSDSIRVQ